MKYIETTCTAVHPLANTDTVSPFFTLFVVLPAYCACNKYLLVEKEVRPQAAPRASVSRGSFWPAAAIRAAADPPCQRNRPRGHRPCPGGSGENHL